MQIWIRPVSLIWILFSSHMKRGLMDQFENTLCNTSGKKKQQVDYFERGIFLFSNVQREIYVSFVWDWRDNHSLAICILSGWESFPWRYNPINWNHWWRWFFAWASLFDKQTVCACQSLFVQPGLKRCLAQTLLWYFLAHVETYCSFGVCRSSFYLHKGNYFNPSRGNLWIGRENFTSS